MKRLLLIAGLACSVLGQTTVLTHATVIDGTGNAPQRDTTIVMENGSIRDIGPPALVQAPVGVAVVDLTDKFIVPGIINAHGHVGANRDPQLRQYALYVVTTTTSMSFDDDDIVQFKEEQK